MKPYSVRIKDLPLEYRKRAFHHMETLDSGDVTANTLSSAFIWHESPEGHDFWSAVDSSSEPNPELPPL